MHQGLVRFPVVVSLDYDPAADDVMPIWRVPDGVVARIRAAYATLVNDVAAHTGNYFKLKLMNGGTAGTATAALGSQIGGTAGWTGLKPVSFGVDNAEVAGGNVIVLDYDETGSGTFAQVIVQLDVNF
jgi:hypothetical protein